MNHAKACRLQSGELTTEDVAQCAACRDSWWCPLCGCVVPADYRPSDHLHYVHHVSRLTTRDALIIQGAAQTTATRCCKGCPDCMGIGSREQIKGMLADIRKVVELCEWFEIQRIGTSGDRPSGYRLSTSIRDVLEPYWSRSATTPDEPASRPAAAKGQEPA